jgi:uncharacterized protein
VTIEYLPVGIKCNLKCTYCYQEPMRDAGNFSAPVNFVRAKETIEKAGSDFALFGGEPLLASIEHLEEVWKFGYEKFHINGIQTNGTLITAEHIKLFKLYNVHAGISIDGPGELNDARCSRVETEQIIRNIKRMKEQGVDVSLIVTIHKLNAFRMLTLLDFFDEMEALGITHINLHNLEVDNNATRSELQLTDESNFLAFKAIYDDSKHSRISYNPFRDIKAILTQHDPSVSCIWQHCDPIITTAVHGINAAGDLTNCGRTNKEGIDWLKSDSSMSLERYQALSRIEWRFGGCKDCQYFFVCKGQCPGTAIDGDWRNRTQDCNFWYDLIDYIGKDLVASGAALLNVAEENEKFIEYVNNQHKRAGQEDHGDVPHGDWHGDHTDASSNGA